jgi:hypothetical protein
LLDDGDVIGPRLTVAGRRVRRALLDGPANRAVYRRYRPGDPDPTPLGDCPATAGAFACTRPAGHRAPQHVAGTGRIVAATWTGDGADLATWDGGPDDLPEVPGPEIGALAEDPTGPARLDRLVNEGLDLVGAIRARLAAGFHRPTPQDEAILAVLVLEPPPFYSGDDLELYGLLTSGWRTCHDAVLLAIAEALEVNP